MSEKVDQWIAQLGTLTTIASSQPQAAYACLTHGLSSKWTFLARTTLFVSHHFDRLERSISSNFIPVVNGQPAPKEIFWRILPFLFDTGVLGFVTPLFKLLLSLKLRVQSALPLLRTFSDAVWIIRMNVSAQITSKSEIHSECAKREKENLQSLMSVLSPSERKVLELAGEKGASSWLTALPIASFGFVLHKRAFPDALALRYGWLPNNLPSHCACGTAFSVAHSLSCLKGGFPAIRHNEIRDVTASLLTEVCHDITVEPHLQPLSGEEFPLLSTNTTDKAWLDIAASGFWGGRYERSFFDMRVFYPFAPSNSNCSSIAKCYKKHENEKKRSYARRILEVEHSSFTPLVFSVTGGMAPECTLFYKCLATLLAEKDGGKYSDDLAWLRCSINFALLRSSIQCLRGSRSSYHHPIHLLT